MNKKLMRKIKKENVTAPLQFIVKSGDGGVL